MKARIIILLLLSAGIAFPAAAKVKVVNRSASSEPSWINGTEQQMIIVSSKAPTMEEARQKCLDNIRLQMLDAISQNIEFSSSEISTQYTQNEMIDFRTQFNSELRKQSANIPYIKGVTLAKAIDSYWEERYDKSTKERYFVLSVKYAFPKSELDGLVAEFEKRDAEMWQVYKECKAGYDDISEYEQIERAVNALNGIKSYFFDTHRRNQVEALQKNYMALYTQINVEVEEQGLGYAEFKFYLGGRQIMLRAVPVMRSQTATELSYSASGNTALLTYAYDACPKGSYNEIMLMWNLPGKRLERNITFTVPRRSDSLRAKGDVYITGMLDEENTISDITVSITFQAEGFAPYTVKRLELKVPALKAPLIIDAVDEEVGSDGQYTLQCSTEASIIGADVRYNTLDILQGKAVVERNGEEQDINIVLPYKIMVRKTEIINEDEE